MATGDTDNRTDTHTHMHSQVPASQDVSITTVLIHLHTLPRSICLSQNPAAHERQISQFPCRTAGSDKRRSLFGRSRGFGLT